jgi:hypothetical protein
MKNGYGKVSTSVLLTIGIAYDTFLCFAEIMNGKGKRIDVGEAQTASIYNTD